MTQEQRKQFFEIRRILDSFISKIVDDPTEINNSLIVIRTWEAGQSYMRNDVRVDPVDGIPYWAMHDHTSVEGQELQPSLTPSMWAHYHGTTPETARLFVQEGHNPYMNGHYCIENDNIYLCELDNTIYAPSVYPNAWKQVL